MKESKIKRVLLVEDDELFRHSLADFLSSRFLVQCETSAEAGLQQIQKSCPDVLLLDITLPGMNGTEALKSIKENWRDLPVIMLTAIDRIPSVVECIKLGAFDYLAKPVNPDELLLSIERALESHAMKQELRQRRKLQLSSNKEYQLIGESPAMKKIKRQIEVVAPHDSPVLIQGETGTGKESIAHLIHSASDRAGDPFVALNCGAIPKDLVESELFGYKKGAFTSAHTSEIGKFVLANHGTLLLDEIGELPLESQAKLLRVLEEQEFYPVGSTEMVKVNVRLIASTNRDLPKLVEEKLFREDLFYRLNVYTIDVPPLRERKEDIIPLAEHFLQKLNVRFGKNFQRISDVAKKALMEHSWRGNARELRNLMERIVLSENGSVIEEEYVCFPAMMSSAEFLRIPPGGVDLEEMEKSLIFQALKLANGNKTKAAKLLHLTPATFYYRLEKYGINQDS